MTLYYGAEGAKVKVIQTYLNLFSLPAPLQVDGIWGSKTEEALMGVESTDKVTPELYARMVATVKKGFVSESPSRSPSSERPPIVKYVMIGGVLLLATGLAFHFLNP